MNLAEFRRQWSEGVIPRAADERAKEIMQRAVVEALQVLQEDGKGYHEALNTIHGFVSGK